MTTERRLDDDDAHDSVSINVVVVVDLIELRRH